MTSHKITPELVAQCMQALMSDAFTSDWVRRHAELPGKGGPLGLWTQLAHEYATEIVQLCNAKPKG